MSRSILLATALLFTLQTQAAELTGTLKSIRDSGRFVIGFPTDARPVSYIDDDGNPTGYSIELCRRIAHEVRRELGMDELRISYVPLDAPQERIDAVVNGQVHIECGASTITLSRRHQVDFTLMTLLTGASVLAERGSDIRSNGDLDGKKIAVIEGTTTEQVLDFFLDTNEFDADVTKVADRSAGMSALNTGKVDAYASDYVMLFGQMLQSQKAGKYVLAKDLFSFEPYAFMVKRNDAEFRLVADRALAKLYRSAAIKRLYMDWFGSAGSEPSLALQAMYEFQALPE